MKHKKVFAAAMAIAVAALPVKADDSATFLQNYTQGLKQNWNAGTQYLNNYSDAACIPQAVRSHSFITGDDTIKAAQECIDNQEGLDGDVENLGAAIAYADEGIKAAAKVEDTLSMGNFIGEIQPLAEKMSQAAEVMSDEHRKLGNIKGQTGWSDVSKKCSTWSNRLDRAAGRLNVASNTAWGVGFVCQCTKAICGELKDRAEAEASAHDKACGNLTKQARAWSALRRKPVC